ncbi:16S rRNA (guanine(527)-N(7))-methyltransferase RsmG [Desulfurobacterium thermolithotrophum]|uniref:16S rRNA (guanine(527)-N(7))-methyltransferase RsmG n=1 Tax=Desulfurobacterium thermolithotrophum TaxID=64160 RepID=UPI0013D31F58|nr:16S rRNA (guanine(527)-N(7))-methyltransferase RsmG [Desulfurobacterium thermolithotrophum]
MSLERLRELCELNEIDLSEEEYKKFERYRELLKKWGKRINITSILSDKEIEEKHFFDSLLGIKAFKLYGLDYHNKLLGDVGSGGGFPGVPLAITIQNSTFDLIESRHKRCVFLEQVKRELKLPNVKVLCTRVESIDRNYDMLLMRAVEDPIEAIKITKHLLEKGAILCIYRGKERFSQEIPNYIIEEISFEVKGIKLRRHFLFIKSAK